MQLLYFAWVRERIGMGGEEVSPPEAVETVADLVAWLSSRSDGHAAAFAKPARLRAAVDQAFVPLDTRIAGAREIAIFPPVTGG
ncbi:molybdopterin converting factor subunit 1 [Sphingomonas sp. RHCKR47]|uniref:molybdopterin converting factor subunit 1 n=1 Tax=Sphingomonas citricola TaxID=2862498 RepID=UPI001CA498B5|nr:molybdopterin converting factor subunit 1 [Sphingomonas citricola]MBW6523893.1 molybdopterin converting factor subunit 1 [Sphingomonas citricola]